MKIKPSQDDILRSKIVDPAWYRVRVNKVSDKNNKKNTGINSWFEGVILRNADNGDQKFAGVPTPYLWLFSSNFTPNAISLLEAQGVEVKADGEYDLQFMQGREVEMFIGNQLNPENGQM